MARKEPRAAGWARGLSAALVLAMLTCRAAGDRGGTRGHAARDDACRDDDTRSDGNEGQGVVSTRLTARKRDERSEDAQASFDRNRDSLRL